MTRDRALLDDWHVAAHADDVRGETLTTARILGEDLVLWRSDRDIEAWRDLCPHRGAKLSLGCVRGGHVVCPYHGLEFEAGGACVRYPAQPGQKPAARAAASTFTARERYGLVWVTLGKPDHEPPAFPEGDDDGFRLYFGGAFPYETSGPRAIENFLDLAHFPFVHPGILGEEPHTEVGRYDVQLTEAGLIVTNCRFWQPKPTNTLDVDGIDVDYTYTVPRPLTARLTKDIRKKKADGQPMLEAIGLSVTPVEEERCIGWVLLASNYDELYDDEDVKAFTELIIGQDVRVVESQRPKRLPLDPGAELHMASDRTSVHYRRWLKALGVTFGTVSGDV